MDHIEHRSRAANRRGEDHPCSLRFFPLRRNSGLSEKTQSDLLEQDPVFDKRQKQRWRDYWMADFMAAIIISLNSERRVTSVPALAG